MTPRQSELLAFIKRYQSDNAGVSPSFAEMSEGIGIRGKAPIHWMLNVLEKDGLIARTPNRARSITVLPQRHDLSAISDAEIAKEYFRRFLPEFAAS